MIKELLEAKRLEYIDCLKLVYMNKYVVFFQDSRDVDLIIFEDLEDFKVKLADIKVFITPLNPYGKRDKSVYNEVVKLIEEGKNWKYIMKELNITKNKFFSNQRKYRKNKLNFSNNN